MAEPEKGRPQAHLIGLLAFASGSIDVVTLMVIGGSFTSVITGNLIFIGRAIGTQSLSPALHAIIAVVGYMAGVAVGSKLRQLLSHGAPQTPWPRSATQVLAVEWALLAALNVAWVGYGAAPPSAAADVLLVAAAVSLGMQGAAARSIKGNPSTTYMTGALTALVEALSTGGHRTIDGSIAVGLLCLVAGAACSAVLVEHASQTALLPPLAALALVVLIMLGRHRREQRAEAERASSATE